MKWLISLLAALMLVLPAAATGPYSVIVGIPSGAETVLETENVRVYCHEDYSITVRRFAEKSRRKAVQTLAGDAVCFTKQRSRFGMEECLLRWYSGGRTKRADILLDGTWCYAVVFSAKTPAYDTLATEVFSTFGLFFDEGA